MAKFPDQRAPQVAPYGSWISPITSDLIVASTVTLGQVALHDADTYWCEGRPAEGGRMVLVYRASDGHTRDVTPPGFNVRTRVHEYGGGSYVVTGATVYFVNFDDQRVYRQDPRDPDAIPQPMTPAGQELRFADFTRDDSRRRLICVREDKRLIESREDVNTLVALDLEGGEQSGRVLVSGNEFYSSPRVSLDGTRLAWLTWNFPDMPWDAAELWVGEFDAGGGIASSKRIAGGPGESCFQPEWSPDGSLTFVSDRDNWWGLYRYQQGRVSSLYKKEAEFGTPQWVFGMSTYAYSAPSAMVCAYTEHGDWHLARLETESSSFTPIDLPYTFYSDIRMTAHRAVFIAGSPVTPREVIQYDFATRTAEVLRRSEETSIDRAYLSIPEPVEFPTEGGKTAHAFFYPPRNRDYTAPAGEKPPLIVKSHGGPTSATNSVLSLSVQYWTSRGFAVLDVNYGGSTGYGRAYRERLKGQWGVVDVDDCVNGARYLVERGVVDGDRLIITGGSAGGYTTLCALAFRDVFRAGASYFGISDLEILASDARGSNSHKFESRYEEGLIAPYPAGIAVYRERSPINYVNQLSCPIIFFQGLEDRVVLPNQAERMVDALRAKRLPVAYIAFEGEGHGFRRAENIKRSLEAELYFYARVFGFELSEPVQPVDIENLPET